MGITRTKLIMEDIEKLKEERDAAIEAGLKLVEITKSINSADWKRWHEAADKLKAMKSKAGPTSKESLTVQPDADGWIKHDPSGPIPERASEARFKDGMEFSDPTKAGWPDDSWNHTHRDQSYHITHYKP